MTFLLLPFFFSFNFSLTYSVCQGDIFGAHVSSTPPRDISHDNHYLHFPKWYKNITENHHFYHCNLTPAISGQFFNHERIFFFPPVLEIVIALNRNAKIIKHFILFIHFIYSEQITWNRHFSRDLQIANRQMKRC